MDNASPSAAAPDSSASEVFLYFGQITLLIYLVLPHGYFLDITTTYMLKDRLHATAGQVSMFRLLTAIPLYVSFLFGLLRDLWNPFGLRDRGYFLIFGPAAAAVFFWMSISNLTYGMLFAGMLLAMVLFRLISAAYQGLLALVGQEKLMSGRLSALWNILTSVPYTVGAFFSGYVTEHVSPSGIFAIVAVVTALIGVFGLWKPRAVFRHTYDRPQASGSSFRGDIRRLLKHRAIYPAVLCLFMFQFSPGSNTPLQFYLTNTLHASDAAYANYNAVFSAAFIPIFFLYGWLCKKVSLEKLLWWGTIIAVPQMIPLVLIHSAAAAVILAAPIGMLGGVAAAAYYDLAMRSCPPGLQGTLMMLVDGFFMLSYRAGDLLGAKIFSSSPEHGFLYCVIATTAVYALILPVLKLVPKSLIATTDGQRSPEVEAQVQSEIAEATGD